MTEPSQQKILTSNKINFFPYSKLINSSVASSYNIFNTHSLPPPPILTAPPPHPLTAPAPNFFYNNQKFKKFQKVSLNNKTLAMITNTTTDASSSTSTPSITAPAPKFFSHSKKFNFFPTKVLVNNLTTTSTRMIADSGCSNHYVMLNTPIINKQVATTPIKVLQPNGTSMISTHTCDLPLATLNPTACRGHTIPALTSGALLSLG